MLTQKPSVLAVLLEGNHGDGQGDGIHIRVFLLVEMMNEFSNKNYNARMHFINDFFQNAIFDYESVRMRGDTGWKSTGAIDITYHSVKGKSHNEEHYHLLPELLCDLSDETVIAICNDLLAKWRKE